MNNKNLKPLNQRTKSEQREIQKKGGEASGESRREKKRLRELAELISEERFDMPMPDKTKKRATYKEGLIYGQFCEAIKGNTAAAKFIATIMGDFVEKKVETVKAEVKTEDSDFDLLDEETQLEIVRKIQDAKHQRYMKEHYGKTDQN